MSVEFYISASLILASLLFIIIRKGGKDEPLSARKVALMGVLLAMALALGIAESFLPSFWIPGMRLGLANGVILLVMVEIGYKEAFAIDLGKTVLIAMFRGTLFGMGGWMSFAGAMASFLGMMLALIFFKKLSLIGVSVFGALLHIAAQFAVGALYLSSGVIFYALPLLGLLSIGTGILNGVLVSRLKKSGVLRRIQGLS